MTTTIEESATAYFSSINPLARKIWEDTKKVEAKCKPEWRTWEWQHREHVLDDFLIHSFVKNRYSEHECAKDHIYPDSFPKLTSSCGEKIVVDFDNDCWTWQDEHSGPFSWKTKSQQDLSLADLEPSELSKPSSKPRRPSPGPPRKITAKLQDENGKGGLSRRIWDSPFHIVERKGDSGYPSSQDSVQSSFDDVRARVDSDLEESVKEQINNRGAPKLAILNISQSDNLSKDIAASKSPKSPQKSPLKSPTAPRLPLSPSFNKRGRSGLDDTGVTLLGDNNRDSVGQDNAAFSSLTEGEDLECERFQPASHLAGDDGDRLQPESGEWANFLGESNSDTPSEGVISHSRRPLIGNDVDDQSEEGGARNLGADIPSGGQLLSSESSHDSIEGSGRIKSGFDFLDNW